jgi:hypothetical protein
MAGRAMLSATASHHRHEHPDRDDGQDDIAPPFLLQLVSMQGVLMSGR